MNQQQTRNHFIDAIRGFAAITMAVFHFLYDVFIIYEKNPHWYSLPKVHLWQQAICQTLIFLSGFVWQWGIRGNLRRGMRFNGHGFLITIITLAVIPSESIWFGILNFMGCAVLLLLGLQTVLKKIPPVCGLAVNFLLFVLCKQIQYGSIGIGSVFRIQVPAVLYSVKILTPFGFPFAGFRSSDYFPLLPWIFLYLCGYFFNRILQEHRVMECSLWQRAARYQVPVLSAVGSRTIWIYLLHQPVCMLVCYLVFGNIGIPH